MSTPASLLVTLESARLWRLVTLPAAALLVALLTLTGPEPSYGQFSVGLTAGANSGNVTGDAPKNASYRGKTGLVAGLILEYGFKPDVALSFQPGIAQKGTTIAFDVPGMDEKRDSIDIALDYIGLPLLMRVVGSGGRWYVTGGPELGIISTATGTLTEGSEEEVDFSDKVESLDFSVNFGIGTFIPIGPIKTFIELRWTQGLLNISNQEDSGIRYRNKGRMLLVGLLYSFGQ